jgi:hypothetical protein
MSSSHDEGSAAYFVLNDPRAGVTAFVTYSCCRNLLSRNAAIVVGGAAPATSQTKAQYMSAAANHAELGPNMVPLDLPARLNDTPQ